jgi:hypothetical protein
MYQQCRHIFTAGHRCRQVALTIGPFCYYHQNRQPRRRRSIISAIRTQPHTLTATPTYDYGAIPVSEPATPEIQPPVQLLFPEDRASIQINLYRIAVAQAENRIDTRTANSMTWNQQVSMANLGRQPLIDAAPATPRSTSANRDDDDSESSTQTTPSPTCPVHRVILTPEGDEIAPPVEILEDNEAEPIHHRLCPCLLCAEKYRNQPPEEHHPNCQCGLCEEAEGTGLREQGSESADQRTPSANECHPERSEAESRDLLLPEPGTTERPGGELSTTTLFPEPCALSPRKRVARAEALLSGSSNRDPLNRPWSIAEYTFGDAVRRHEAQYAARAAAALAVGIEPPPYEPYITGLIYPGTPEHEEDQQMQQRSSEYWTAHFRKLIAERPDIQQALAEEEQQQGSESAISD